VNKTARFFNLFLLLVCGNAFAQKNITRWNIHKYSCINEPVQTGFSKPIIDTPAIKNWIDVDAPSISDDGKYVGFIIRKGGFGGYYTLNIQSTSHNWQKTFDRIRSYSFLSYKNKVVIHTSGDSLIILEPGTDKIELIPEVLSYKIQGTYLFYKDNKATLTIVNTKSGNIHTCSQTYSWYTNILSNFVVIISQTNDSFSLSWINLLTGKQRVLGKFKSIDNLIFNHRGDKLAFLGDNQSIYYGEIPNSTIQIINPVSKNNGNTSITAIQKFSIDGKLLFVKQTDQKKRNKSSVNDNLLIWNHADTRLKSQQIRENRENSYVSIINLSNHYITRIEENNENVSMSVDLKKYIIINKSLADFSERHWNPNAVEKHYLYSINHGARVEFPLFPTAISPNEKYIIGTDGLFTELRSYNIETKELSILTKKTNQNTDSIAYEDRELYLFAGWHGKDRILFYDSYDIWELDVKNPDKRVNITGGFGRQHQITLRFANEKANHIFDDKDMSLLTAFDHRTKQNGFYKLTAPSISDPIKLSMRDAFLNAPTDLSLPGFYPVKARNANLWIVRSETAGESQNYEITTNFKEFKKISNVSPETNYNWLTTKLIDFTTLDGASSQAIVYLPGDFDSSKKYPVIIVYYEKLTQKLNYFLKPELSSDQINIPWFVSRGYIVCTPDILYKKGEPGQSAVNAVEGLANYISIFPYIDSAHIGIDGHSFGAYETNFIVTHSTKFAAAVSTSGFSDLVSHVGSVMYNGGRNFVDEWAEIGQGRLEHNLWDRPDLYIKNSPVFFVKDVITPILTMNNEKDGIINASQGIEFFIALRRLGKQTWMLQYKNGLHSLLENEDQWDYTNKIEQFYGHFLKGEPMPEWMKAEME
jgi:dipeptidyl aminopeptidase/acylaminoacyl peptidase